MKVYQGMFVIKNKIRTRKALLDEIFYKQRYFVFYPDTGTAHQKSQEEAKPYYLFNRLKENFNKNQQMKRNVAFPSYHQDEKEELQTIVKVKTTTNPCKPSYFLGDHLGILTWTNSKRKFETIEVSIKFDDEEGEEEDKGEKKNKEFARKI